MAHRVILLGLGQGPLVGQRAQPTQQLAIHLSATVIFAVKSAALLALLTVHRWPISLLRIGTALTLVANEGSDDVAVLASGGLSVCLDILLALLADGGCTALVFLLKLCAAVCALDNGEGASTVLC